MVRDYRAEISRADRTILETVNHRLDLVTRLHAYKAEQGYAPVDRTREEALLRDLRDANEGPLSGEGVEELVGAILDLTKRELDRRRWP